MRFLRRLLVLHVATTPHSSTTLCLDQGFDPIAYIFLFIVYNIFEISNNEMYEMTSNVLSINSNIVVSQPIFERLNTWLESKDLIVEKVDLSEISKQEGLFRCTSLPLIRT